jgi:hypothetical protein
VLINQSTAIDDHDVPGDKRCAIRTKVGHRVGDLLRLTDCRVAVV